MLHSTWATRKWQRCRGIVLICWSNYIGQPYVTKNVYRIADSKLGIEPELLNKSAMSEE